MKNSAEILEDAFQKINWETGEKSKIENREHDKKNRGSI